MTGKKKSNFYRKKRKGKPFKGVQAHAKKAKETPPADIKTPLRTLVSACERAN